MHFRLQVPASAPSFTHQVDVRTLTAFSERTVYWGLEWSTPITTVTLNNATALMLECASLRMPNTWASWSRAPAAVLALYPLGYAREYGRSYDSPYLQSSSICGVSHGDTLNRLGTLDFRLLAENGP